MMRNIIVQTTESAGRAGKIIAVERLHQLPTPGRTPINKRKLFDL